MKLRTVESVLDIPADQWNACANPSGFNPFVSHEFFKALEDSGSATGRTGWKAEHLIYETATGEIEGIAPCFVKPHSQGEYVFDHGWAEAYHRAGGRYYPKLQSSVPFTPVTGPRLFSASAETRALLAKGLVSVCKELKASSSPYHLSTRNRLGGGGQGPVAATAGHSVPLAKPGLHIL